MRIINLVGLSLLLLSCSNKEDRHENNHQEIKFEQYSEFVKDTFYIQVHLPNEYYSKPERKYPVAVLLDGNFYYPIMSSIVQQYEVAGLLQPMILVGVGYKSFKAMDSLRVRDYLFPKALPSDELESVGGGLDFFNYLTKELMPEIDKTYRTEEGNRSLLGHSFAGYFVLYSLFNQTAGNKNEFQNFITASPSLWYNNFYLNQLPGRLAKTKPQVSVFMSVGEMEDSTWSVKPVVDLTAEIKKNKIEGLQFESRIYNHLEHMDVGILTFTKGLQEVFKIEEN